MSMAGPGEKPEGVENQVKAPAAKMRHPWEGEGDEAPTDWTKTALRDKDSIKNKQLKGGEFYQMIMIAHHRLFYINSNDRVFQVHVRNH